MSVENIIEGWREVRTGLIDEANQIPAEQFGFQPAPDTRSVRQLLHISSNRRSFLSAKLAGRIPT
jgi:hypothetical protein